MTQAFSTPPDAAHLAALAERALGAIPEHLRRHVAGVLIVIEELADDELIAEMGFESAWELTGLYHGVPLGDRSVGDAGRLPDRIVLYRQPILLEWIELGEDLFALVRNVLVHEIGHHFGLTDADIERLERQN